MKRRLAVVCTLLMYALFPICRAPGDSFDFDSIQTLASNGTPGVLLRYQSDTNYNYVLEFREDLNPSACRGWQTWANPPHNEGSLFITNSVVQRFFRLRRINVPRLPLFAMLANDTGANSADGITSDATITGVIFPFQSNSLLRASLDNADGPWFQVSVISRSGHFEIDTNELSSISGGSVPDGPHALYLQLSDPGGNLLATNVVQFQLLTKPPPLALNLPEAFDSPPAGDGKTSVNPIDLHGQSVPIIRHLCRSSGRCSAWTAPPPRRVMAPNQDLMAVRM